MKRSIPLALVAAVLVFSASECGNKDESIVYPENGSFGENILRESDIGISSHYPGMEPTYFYSMRAELPEETTLEVIMINNSNNEVPWIYERTSRTGWTVGDFTNNSQNFTVTGPATADLELYFYGSGSASIELYENGSSEATRVKEISW